MSRHMKMTCGIEWWISWRRAQEMQTITSQRETPLSDHPISVPSAHYRQSTITPEPVAGTPFFARRFRLECRQDTIIDSVRPYHLMDGLPVISWRHFLQAGSQLKPGRAVGTDGLNAEVMQCLSMRDALLLWCILNVTSWASTSPQSWTLSPAACLTKDWPLLKAVRHRVDRWRWVCLNATLAQVFCACLRHTALDGIHKAIPSSPLLCFQACLGRQCADMILTGKLLIEKRRMWLDRLLAMIKLDVRKAFDHLYRSKVSVALDGAGGAPETDLGLMR